MFSSFGGKLDYRDIIQLDGAFALSHENYGRSPEFVGESARDHFKGAPGGACRFDDLSGIAEALRTFNGTMDSYRKCDQLRLWKSYWLEYIHVFDHLCSALPDSVVTVYIGRHATELGLKYLRRSLFDDFSKDAGGHDLGKLAKELLSRLGETEPYLDGAVEFCATYGDFVEGGNAEYFRYPEYKPHAYFAGAHLDVRWLSYDFALVLLKLLHLAGLDDVGSSTAEGE